MIVKWYVRISSLIGTIVIIMYVGDTVVQFAKDAAQFLEQLGRSF